MDTRTVVERWHQALAVRDLDAMTALIAPTVTVSGPRGDGVGDPHSIRDWVERSGIRLDLQRVFHRGDAVVVEQHAWWPTDGSEDHHPLPATTIYTAFQVETRRITRILRFDELAQALEFSGLGEHDETTST